jgi:hypothetical protein
MTLAMPDSINPAALPPGYPAYLGYADGLWPTAAELRTKFPTAHIVTLTVTGSTLNADGCDIESGDLTPHSGAHWAARKLAAAPSSRPVLYASVGTMPEVISQCGLVGVSRATIRLLSAHYGDGEHICGPHSCGQVNTDMNGTQWTDQFAGIGELIDMSVLHDDFFRTQAKPPAPTAPAWQEEMMKALPTVHEGMTGPYVRTVQGLCIARGHNIAVDGMFGPNTKSAVMGVQSAAHIPADGIVGPQTWPVLMGVA